MSEALTRYQVRFCPSGELTYDEEHRYRATPRRGDTVRDNSGNAFIVVTVDWGEHLTADHTPYIVVHSPDRPRAQALRGRMGEG